MQQTHDIKLAESFLPIPKKLETFNDSTKKLGEILQKSSSENENNQEIVPVEIESEDGNNQPNIGALPNSSIFIDLMTKRLSRLMSSLNSLKTIFSPPGAIILGVPIYTLGGDKLRTRDNDCELTPEI